MNKNKIINRTPHEIRVLPPGAPPTEKPLLILPPPASRGDVARVDVAVIPGWSIDLGDGVRVRTVSQRWGQITGLAEPQAGVYQVVSTIVAAAARHHGRTTRDLLVPGDHVRDAIGRIVGCRGLCEAFDAMPTLGIGARVWTTFRPEELLALGVPDDIVAAAATIVGTSMWKIRDAQVEATADERVAWDLMVRLYEAHFGDRPRPRGSGGRVERYDLAELATGLLHRPHLRTIASSD